MPKKKAPPLICHPVLRWVPFVISCGVSVFVFFQAAALRQEFGFLLEFPLFLGQMVLLVVQLVLAIVLGCTAGWNACVLGCLRLAVAAILFFMAFKSHFIPPDSEEDWSCTHPQGRAAFASFHPAAAV